MEVEAIINTVKNREPSMLGFDKLRKYAVLVPLVQVDGETHLLFEVRSLQLRSQPGDICFPGGRVDETDKSFRETAIRETTEELGIEANSIQHVYPLDYLVFQNSRIIYPFVGAITDMNSMQINKAEVEEVFTIPLSFFLENEPDTYKIYVKVQPEEKFPFDLIHRGRDYKFRSRDRDESFYRYGDRVIWGLTARIIKHFLEVVREGR